MDSEAADAGGRRGGGADRGARRGVASCSAFGIPFLGRPRSDEAAKAREVDRFLARGDGRAAALCLLAGVFPGVVIDT